jgi:alpha-L-fucosidase
VEYATGEHMVGRGKWESTRGLGLAFGYNAAEATDDYMTGDQLLDLYREVTAGGGNLLINVGPRADASIPEVQQQPLLEIGRALA